jgi:Ca-activated chloride channel family protein
MNRSRRTFLALVVAGAAMAGVVFVAGRPAGLSLPEGMRLPGMGGVELTIASSVTKQKWLEAAAESFNAAGIRTAAGEPVAITISNVLSGDSMMKIAEGSLQPVVWSPGEAAWVDQLNERWGRTHTTPIASQPCAPTVRTPVGLAMWRPMAEALGWPERPVSMKQLVDLANDPQGWASLGHPEWGRLRLGHTHPGYSSAGLLFLASVIYATSGKTAEITTADIYSDEVRLALQTLAQNTTKYGMVTTDLLTAMAQGGPEALHATSAFEEGTVRFNLERGEDLRWPLAFLFPQEGTFWSDHPFCILDKSGWVTPEQAEAAALFRDHLLSAPVQADAGRHAIRPLDGSAPAGSVLTAENGTTPAATPATVPPFAIPSPEVSEAIIDLFQITKRKATVVLVLDISSSMSGKPIKAATEASAEFIGLLHPDDRAGLVVFSALVKELSPISPVREVGEAMAGQVLNLTTEGGTALHDGVCRARNILAREMAKDEAAGENRLYGIVLLSDGADTSSAITESEMFLGCMRAPEEGSDPPKVFVVAFGDGADLALLKRLASETRGAVFSADAASIGGAYLKIAAEQ